MAEAITSLDEAKRVLADLAKKTGHLAARLTRSELMAILARIYAIRLPERDHQRLLDYVIEQRKMEGANRAYLLRVNNPFVLPLRYVFPSVKDRSNVSRYAGALRELNRREVRPEAFGATVKASGGLTTLYWDGRARETKQQVRNKLTLDQSIKIESGRPFTVQLLPQANGIFKLLDGPVYDEVAEAAE